MSKPSIQVLVGIIGSGKSSYALNAARAGFTTVNNDLIVQAVHSADYLLYDRQLEPLYKALSVNVLTHSIALGRSVVIDTGGRKRKTRSRWVSLAHALDVPVYAVVFPVEPPVEHAKRRFRSDSRGYSFDQWLEVALHQADVFEPVEPDEGFDHIDFVQWERIRDGYYYRPSPVNER